MDQPPHLIQLSSNLIILRNLQTQIQSGNHPIYKLKSSSPENSSTLPKSSSLPHPASCQSYLPPTSTSFLPSQSHTVSYHQTHLFHQPLCHHQDISPHASFSCHASPNYGHSQQIESDLIPSSNQNLPNQSWSTNHRQSLNPNQHEPYSTHRRSSDAILVGQSKNQTISSINKPIVTRDPRLMHNRLLTQSGHHSASIHPPLPYVESGPNIRNKQQPRPKNSTTELHHFSHCQSPRPNDQAMFPRFGRSLESHSPPRTNRQDEIKRGSKQIRSDHSLPKCPSESKDPRERQPRDRNSNKASKNHSQITKSPTRNQAHHVSKRLRRIESINTATSSAEEEEENAEDAIDLSSELEADQKRRQQELPRDHTEFEIYQQKGNQRDAVAAITKLSDSHDCTKKPSKIGGDSTDEYLQRSLEAVGDPSHQNRRFSVAGDRSTLIPSSNQIKSPTRDHSSNRVDVIKMLAKAQINKTDSNAEKETVEAAAVLLGLGLSQSLVSVTTTTTTTSKIITKHPDPATVINDMLMASTQLSDNHSMDQVDNTSVVPISQSKKKPSVNSRSSNNSNTNRKKTPSFLLKCAKPLTPIKSINQHDLLKQQQVVPNLINCYVDNQLIMFNKNQNKQKESNKSIVNNKDLQFQKSLKTPAATTTTKDPSSKKKQKLIKLDSLDENLKLPQAKTNQIFKQDKKKLTTIHEDGSSRLVHNSLLDHVQKNNNNIDDIQEDESDDEHKGGNRNTEEMPENKPVGKNDKNDNEDENQLICHVLRNRKIIKYSQ